MKPRSQPRPVLALLAIALLLTALALALGAAEARASDGGMAGMPGMTEEEMQNMGQPSGGRAGATVQRGAGTKQETGDGPAHEHGQGSINWFVIGGFIVLVVGSTIGAMATKRHLARRMASGELAGAGALDV